MEIRPRASIESGFEEGARAGADAPSGAAEGDVAGNILSVVEDDDGLVWFVVSGPVGAAADHGFMSTDREFINDKAFAGPVSDSLLRENGSGGAGAGLQEFAFPESAEGGAQTEGENHNKHDREKEQVHRIGAAGRVE